jgi:hypothetical protein
MDDWHWAATLRERTLKATLDKPVLQYMLDTGCSLSKAVDVFHDLLIQDEALRQMVGFIDQQLLIDGMVEIEETGILREGPRRTEYASIPERRQQFELERRRRIEEQPELRSPQAVDEPEKPSFDPNVGYQFFSDLAGEIRGIGLDQNERSWDGDSIALQRTVARRVSELAVRMDVDVDTLCNELRSVLGEAQLLPAARRAIEDGLDLLQYPTPGSRLVDDLVAGFPIRDDQEGGWSLDDMRSVIDHHVGWLVEKGEMSRDMICEDIAGTIRAERFRHDLHPQAVSDILNLLSTLQ